MMNRYKPTSHPTDLRPNFYYVLERMVSYLYLDLIGLNRGKITLKRKKSIFFIINHVSIKHADKKILVPPHSFTPEN